MVNYLARRVNPTPYINFMPPELIMFGEENMVAAFRSSPAGLCGSGSQGHAGIRVALFRPGLRTEDI